MPRLLLRMRTAIARFSGFADVLTGRDIPPQIDSLTARPWRKTMIGPVVSCVLEGTDAMRLSTSCVGIAIVAALTTGGTEAASVPESRQGQAQLCLGHVATIVGAPGEKVIGTDGPDVVRTNGAYASDTLGGDDLLCVDKAAEPGNGESYDDFYMAAGPGDDRIDATNAHGGYFKLGPGADHFTGSDDGFDTVYADDLSSSDVDSDTINGRCV